MLSDIAHTDVLTASPDTSVGDLAGAMRRRDESLVAVLDEGRPRGVVTDADIGRAFVAGEDLTDRTAGSLLDGDAPTVRASADLSALVATFADEGVRPVLVVDGEGGFVGVATFDDALAAYGRDLAAVLDLVDG